MSKFNKHIIIVGTARSGTSWLSEIMARQYRYRLLFEPEHESRTTHGHLVCDQFIETGHEANDAYNYLKKVFYNRVDCDWIAQNSNRKFKMHLWPFIPKKYIIKFVRANLSAKYMNNTFNIPVVHIIRNPYDVLKSQKRANFPWLLDLSRFAKQDFLVALINSNFGFDITQYSDYTDLEILSLRWCIENVIPLEVLKINTSNYLVIKYEELMADINAFYNLCEQFNIEPIEDITEAYSQPSSKTHKNSVIRTNKENTIGLAPSELKEVNKILDMFKTQLYPRKMN